MLLIIRMLTDINLMWKKKRSNFLKIFVDGGEIVLYKNLHAISVRSLKSFCKIELMLKE